MPLQPYKMRKKIAFVVYDYTFTSFMIISVDIPHFNCFYCAMLLVSMTFENSV